MTDTPRSTSDSPGTPDTPGNPPAPGGEPVSPRVTTPSGSPPSQGGGPAESGATPQQAAPAVGLGKSVPGSAPDGRSTAPSDPTQIETEPGQPAGGQPVYGPPGTGTDPNSATGADAPVYGYQAVGTGIPGHLDIGHALSYGVEKFRLNPGPWVAVTSLGVIIYLAFYAIVQLFEPTSALPLILLFAGVMAGLWVLQAALVRGALYETDGYRPGFGSYFYVGSLGNAFLTALLAFLATTLASALCLVPGILVGIGCMFSLHFAVEQGQTPVEAIKSSFLLVLRDPGRVLLLVLTVLVVTLLGLLACGFGLLAAGPVAAIAVTYAYRTLTGGPISPV
ncbi:hypothetical protein [Nocardia sp. NPDC024068]|uniref:hypothetical protein n=1 Tax=Nocardia sp. NPDC024068 TaxID=3157197 RepID=UPI0033CBAAE0